MTKEEIDEWYQNMISSTKPNTLNRIKGINPRKLNTHEKMLCDVLHELELNDGEILLSMLLKSKTLQDWWSNLKDDNRELRQREEKLVQTEKEKLKQMSDDIEQKEQYLSSQHWLIK